MNSISNPPYVEVYIWRARDENGLITDSGKGARIENARGKLYAKLIEVEKTCGSDSYDFQDILARIDALKLGRVGHGSLGIFPGNRRPVVYASLWPNHKTGASTLVPSLEKDIENEKTKPDVIIRLHHLNIEAMIQAFNRQIKRRVDVSAFYWNIWNSSAKDNACSDECSVASCVTLVWSLLKVGGIDKTVNSLYSKHVRKRGPKDSTFYSILKCNVAKVAAGIFDGVSWTTKFFSPYALSLRAGSAAEAYDDDKKATISIMESDRVEKSWEKFSTQELIHTHETMMSCSTQEFSSVTVEQNNKVEWSNGEITGLVTASAVIIGGISVLAAIFKEENKNNGKK